MFIVVVVDFVVPLEHRRQVVEIPQASLRLLLLLLLLRDIVFVVVVAVVVTVCWYVGDADITFLAVVIVSCNSV